MVSVILSSVVSLGGVLLSRGWCVVVRLRRMRRMGMRIESRVGVKSVVFVVLLRRSEWNGVVRRPRRVAEG